VSSPSLSLCMIVKNEEHSIGSCLTSVRSLVNEMIVVDTGSTDRTRELALAFGAKVYDFKWENDFSAARNYALDRASGDWIMVLDADEVLQPVDPEILKPLLEAPGVEGYYVFIQSYVGDGAMVAPDRVVRLFKNKPWYRFAGAIHEQVAGSIREHNRGGGLAFSDLVIHHFGYLAHQVGLKQKHRRNISVIEKALAAKPNDPFLLFSLGTEYLQQGEISKGAEQLEKALTLMRGTEGYFHNVLTSLGLAFLQSGEMDRLNAFLDKAGRMLPDDPDLNAIRGMAALRAGDGAQAALALNLALSGGSKVLPSHSIHSLLGDACRMAKRYETARDHYLQALRLAPHVIYPLTQILEMIGREQVSPEWVKLARLISPGQKESLVKGLLDCGERHLALVTALLAVVESAAAGDPRQLAKTCETSRRIAEQLYDSGPTAGPCHKYQLVGTAIMQVHAEAAQAGLSCPLFNPIKGLLEQASAMLELQARRLMMC